MPPAKKAKQWAINGRIWRDRAAEQLEIAKDIAAEESRALARVAQVAVGGSFANLTHLVHRRFVRAVE